MREIRQSGSEGGGAKPIASPYPYFHSFSQPFEKALAVVNCVPYKQNL